MRDENALRPATDALFDARTVMIFGEIDMDHAREVCAQLLALATKGSKPIRVVVNSPGGHVESGDTIHDMIRAIEPEVIMIGTGWVASAGALIFAAAEKKNRYALPNTRFMLHQPLGGSQGRASDIEIEAQQIVQMRDRLNRTFARATGQDYEKIARDTERNFWMNAGEAIEYGLLHRVIERLSDV